MLARLLISRIALAAVCFHASSAHAADTAAHRSIRHFMRGANFGNYLEAPRGVSWGARYDLSDLDNLKKEGFDHLRLPIAWHHYSSGGPDFRIDAALYAKVDFLVTNAVSRNLGIILNIHHFDEFTSNPVEQKTRFFALWQQVAEHYRSQPNELVAFELLNEPKDAATTEVMNPIYAEAIAVIRRSNPDRPIFVGPGKWNSLDEVEKLKLPDNDRNLIVTVHSYEPFYFTHQGASWTMPDTATTGIVYPGPPREPRNPNPVVTNKQWIVKWIEDYNKLPTAENPSSPKAFTARMEKVAKWAADNNRPIHLGEFGAYTKADAQSRARYYTDMRKTAERLGFAWAVWDWKAGFKYWDETKPAEGLRDALFRNN